MELKGRLGLIANKVPPCDMVCDIGTDHAYVPIALIEEGKCKRAVACDVRKGPVNAAKNNIAAYGFSDRIDVRMGYGLEPVNRGEANVVIIAGMGGTLITEILAKDSDKARAADLLVLQPMNGIDEVRQWLGDEGFDIRDEELVAEGRRLYNVITAVWTGERLQEPLHFLHIGRKLVEKKDPLLKCLINRRLGQLDRIIEQLKKSGTAGNTLKKQVELRQGLESILNSITQDI